MLVGGFFDCSSIQEEKYRFKYWLFSACITTYLWRKFSIFWGETKKWGLVRKK